METTQWNSGAAIERGRERVRILFALTSPARGGVEEVVLSLLRGLPQDEFESALAAPAALLHLLADDLRDLGVRTTAVAADGWSAPRKVAALASCIRRFRPHLVSPHLFRSTLVAAPLAKWLGVPRVVETYHGREAWRRGLVKGSFVVDRVVSRWVDRVIAVSEAARTFLIHRKGIPAEKVVVVPNGRDLSVFKPGRERKEAREELGVGPGDPVIGVIGRLEEQKGHTYALEAFREVAAEFPGARLAFVGDGSLRRELQARACALGLRSQVLFMGFRADVPRLIDAIDLLALPSLYEGMPLTAIEGSAMAKPVVATWVDGTCEVVRNGVTGRLVPPANPAALAAAMLGILRNPMAARRMGEAGRQHVLARFDIGRQVEATAAVYRQVLGLSSPAGGHACAS